MINGEEDVIKASKYVSDLPNNEGGVGDFLEKYLQNKGLNDLFVLTDVNKSYLISLNDNSKFA